MEVIRRQDDWLDAKSVLRNQIFFGVTLCFWVIPTFREISVFSCSWVTHSVLVECCNVECDGITILRTFGSYLLNDSQITEDLSPQPCCCEKL